MSTIRTPTGPLPPGVYWRRRIVVLVILVALVAIVVAIVWPRGGEKPQPVPHTSAVATAPTPGQTGSGGTCDPSKVELTAETDASSYQAGQQPQIWMTVTSRETVECTLDVGTASQEFLITSGSDRIWSSKDCQTDNTPAVVILKPGVPVSTKPIPWDRTRSAKDTCNETRDAVTADGASYHLEVRIGDLVSKSTKQFLLY